MPRKSTTRERLEMLTPPLPWHRPHLDGDRDAPVVVVLHGLWRSKSAMQPLCRALQHGGFATLNIPYPSSRLPMHRLVDHVSTIIEANVGDRPVHAVTHSLGGILARSALAASRWNLHRLVMIAPPSSGSEIIDHLSQLPLIHHLLGPAGMALGTTGIPAKLPPLAPTVEAAAIMGRRDSIKCFSRLLDGPHDGIVTVAGGRNPDLKGFAVVDSDHTFITAHPETQRLTLQFLHSGTMGD